MQAIILAAGMGKRLQGLTKDNTKCMVKVNGIPMIKRSLDILENKGLSRIILVVGYKGEKLIEYVNQLSLKTPIEFIENTVFDKTNNIYSLALAKDYLCTEDTLLLESDLIFEEEIIDILLEDERKNLALVDKFESWMDGTCMEIDQKDCIVNFIPGKHLEFQDKDKYYKTVNIYKFSREFSENIYVPFLSAYEKAMGENEYYESVIKLIAMLETKELQVKRLEGQKWYEIDNIQDLDIAESIFCQTEKEQLKKIEKRYGGYWRYPQLLDFCYLVNPYFPCRKMLEEIKSNFEILFTQYPSGMEVNTLLVANNFGVNKEHIVVGNGAAELIKLLLEKFDGKLGCIYPTFMEYPNRYEKEKIVAFYPDNDNFQYSVDDLIAFYEDNNIANLVLINPDNPSGNYILPEELIRLIDWCKLKKIKLIVDESFVDFTDIDAMNFSILDVTMIREKILERYSGLYVIKSISKSYGIPGVRLGVLASSDSCMIEEIKKNASIWNINSFAEFTMQIMEKYMKDYYEALKRFRLARKDLVSALSTIDFFRVIPSQANYVMCEVIGKKSEDLCKELLKSNVFIKDLTGKLNNGHEYIRIAVRDDHDNAKLVEMLQKLADRGEE